MRMTYNIAMLLVLSSGLMACQKDDSEAYMLAHPHALKANIDRCQAMQQKTPADVLHCEMVVRAADKINAYINEEQQNPEQFGQKILALQSFGTNLDAAQQEELTIRMTVVGMSSPE
jgi:hypothetical protein